MNAALKLSDNPLLQLASVCNVIEFKAPHALVQADPAALVGILSLGFTIKQAKRGAGFYAVTLAQTTALPASNDVAPVAPQPAPKPVPVPKPTKAPANDTVPQIGRTIAMCIKGETYEVTETNCKRKVDVRRWECAKPDGSDTYIVTFQDHDGHSTACSCKGGIFHKHCKHMDAIRSMFGAQAKSA